MSYPSTDREHNSILHWAKRLGNQILGAGWNLITFDTMDIDTKIEFNQALSIFTPTQTGIYHITLCVTGQIAAGVNFGFNSTIEHNGAVISQRSESMIVGNFHTNFISVVVELTAGDVIRFRCLGNLAPNIITIIGATHYTYFNVVKIK